MKANAKKVREIRVKKLLTMGGLIGVSGVVVAAIAAWAYMSADHDPKNFGVVVPGRIYRSAQPGYHELEKVQRETGIKAIINLRGKHVFKDDWRCREESQCAEDKGIKLIVIEFGNSPSDERIKELLAALDDEKNYPLLIHCAQGIERTGIAVAVYRMERMGWTSGQAVREMLTNKFSSKLKVVGDHVETIFVAEYKAKHPAPAKKPLALHWPQGANASGP